MNFFSWVCPRNTVHSNSRSPSQHIYYFSYCSNSISISSAVSDECILSNYYLIYNVEQRLATGWTVRRSNPGGARFSAPVQTGPGAHLASCTIGTGSFPGVKSDRDVTLTPHPLLVPWSWKSRAIPLLPLWAVRPVQSLSACTRVHFTFTLLCFVILWTLAWVYVDLVPLSTSFLVVCAPNSLNGGRQLLFPSKAVFNVDASY